MKKKIIINHRENPETVKHLQEILNIDKNLANLLAQKGVTNFDEAKNFFRPSLDNLHDPFLMKDMDKAVARLIRAITGKEKILILGDYDVDGTTSVALIYSFLKELHSDLLYYVPNRYSEGYGISYKSIDYAKENFCTLVIALDCGIKAVDKIDYANRKNIDFIICDHHKPGAKIPEAVAVLDPKRTDCNYPFKELSGCGVGFKFLQAFSKRKGISYENIYKYLDLVVVSIASDIVKITGENRILAHYGLKNLNENPVKGLESIIKIAGVENKTLTISDCVFKIGPRINAAGRIKSGKYAVQLLITKNLKEATTFGKQIDNYNTDRKSFDRKITHEALRIIGNDIRLRNKKTTVIYNPNWHKGVVGIVASRLTETYYRPTIVLTKSNEKATGSARSVSDFNLYAGVEYCSNLLESFGGHIFAAGLTMKIENIEKFADCFENYVAKHITQEQMIPNVKVDLEINFSDITPKFFRIMKQFAPFGPGNMSPVFLTRNVKDTGRTLPVGQNKEHLKVEMADENNNILEGIAFSLSHHYKNIRSKKSFSVCYSLEENKFRGITKIQAAIKYIHFD